MSYARFQAALSRPESNGVSRRASLEASAAKGNAVAIDALISPYFPDTLGYLWEWMVELRQGLGSGMEGLASLTWTTLDAWCRRTQRNPDPEEVSALFALDSALRADPTPAVAAPEDSKPERIAAWPSQKAGA